MTRGKWLSLASALIMKFPEGLMARGMWLSLTSALIMKLLEGLMTRGMWLSHQKLRKISGRNPTNYQFN